MNDITHFALLIVLATVGIAGALGLRLCRRRAARRRSAAPLRQAVQRLRPPQGASRVERFALAYLQVDALLLAGADRNGLSTCKIGGLQSRSVDLDSWSLARDMLLGGIIGLRTYATYTLCRRAWNHLLAGSHARLAERHVRRCEHLVERLHFTLEVPVEDVRERVSSRLAAAGVEVAQ